MKTWHVEFEIVTDSAVYLKTSEIPFVPTSGLCVVLGENGADWNNFKVATVHWIANDSVFICDCEFLAYDPWLQQDRETVLSDMVADGWKIRFLEGQFRAREKPTAS